MWLIGFSKVGHDPPVSALPNTITPTLFIQKWMLVSFIFIFMLFFLFCAASHMQF